VIKLKRFIIIESLNSFLSTPELGYSALDVDLNEAIGAGVICIPHEDMINLIVCYFLRRGIPKYSWIVRFALLCCGFEKSQQADNKKDEPYTIFHILSIFSSIAGRLIIL